MSRFTKFGVLLTLVMVFSMAAPAFAQGGITYNSYNGDPLPRAFDEMVVGMWNDANPDQQVAHSIVGSNYALSRKKSAKTPK